MHKDLSTVCQCVNTVLCVCSVYMYVQCLCVCVSVCTPLCVYACVCLPSQLPHLPDRLRLPWPCQPIRVGLRTAGPEVVAMVTRRPVCMVADGRVMDYSNGMEGGNKGRRKEGVVG